ncbi:hypothetical protein CY35_06G091700 [Sphagnum magellanicum]|nr:hypothetical protein CY35_06G091700 [Sphagnum magellanicum]
MAARAFCSRIRTRIPAYFMGELEPGQGGLRRQFLCQTENGREAATSCALEGLGLNCKIVGSVDNKTVVSHPIDVKAHTLHQVQGPVTIRNLALRGSSTVYSCEHLGSSPFLVHETIKRNRLWISHLPDSEERICFGSTLSNPCVIQQCLVDQKWRGARQICLLPHAHLSSGASSITRVQSRLYAGNPALSSIQSQSSSREHLTDSAVPNSLIEEKLSPVLARPDLLITRNVEWANLAFGFEQQNRYVIMDPRQPQAPVGFIVEDSNILLRQFMRTRRPFTASVMDAVGNEILRVVGECHRRWHLWRRNYDVYLGKTQFAAVENPGFWHWTFTLKDQNQGVLAEIDRNWRGFGYEFLTDAGQYVIQFGDTLPKGIHPASPVLDEDVQNRKPLLSSTQGQSGAQEMQQLQAAATEAEELRVSRPLNLVERAVALALAVSLDNDYFSRHSQPGVGFPMPIPFFGSEATSEDPTTSTSQSETASTPHAGYGGEFGRSSEDENRTGETASPSSVNNGEAISEEDPYFGMFDDQSPGEPNSDFLFDDPEPPAETAGSDWGFGDWEE